MLNVLDIQDQLKNFSEQQLVKEMQMPSGNAPQFLVLSEINRRKRMKDAQKANEAAQMKTVAQDLVTAAGVPQQGIMQMAQAMNPKSSNAQNAGLDAILQKQQQQQPQQGAPVPQMYGGGYVKRMQAGGMPNPAGRRVVINGKQYIEAGPAGFLMDAATGQMVRREDVEGRVPTPMPRPEGLDIPGADFDAYLEDQDARSRSEFDIRGDILGSMMSQYDEMRGMKPDPNKRFGAPTGEEQGVASFLGQAAQERAMGLDPFGGTGEPAFPPTRQPELPAPLGSPTDEMRRQADILARGQEEARMGLEPFGGAGGVSSPSSIAIDFDATTGMFDGLPEEPRRRGRRGGGANEEQISSAQPATGMFDIPSDGPRPTSPFESSKILGGIQDADFTDPRDYYDFDTSNYSSARGKPNVPTKDQSAQDQAVQAQEEAEKIRAESLSLERQIEDATGESTDLESQILQMLKDREASQEKDKWLALATAGLEIMGGANIGKAGASALKQYTQGSRDFDKDKLSYLLAVNKIREAKKKKGMSIGDASDLYRALQGELTDVLESLRKAQMADGITELPNPEVINSLKARAAMLQSQINRYKPMLGLGSLPSTFDARVGG